MGMICKHPEIERGYDDCDFQNRQGCKSCAWYQIYPSVQIDTTNHCPICEANAEKYEGLVEAARAYIKALEEEMAPLDMPKGAGGIIEEKYDNLKQALGKVG